MNRFSSVRKWKGNTSMEGVKTLTELTTHLLPMKNTLILSFLLAVPALAGTSQVMTEPTPPPPQQDIWRWFIGGSGGYLLDYEEDMYTLQIGAKSPWSFGGWSVSLFGEAGWTENHDQSVEVSALLGDEDADLDIIPVTFNVKLERLLSGNFGLYLGGGLGGAYVDSEFDSPIGSDNDSENDWVFTGQVFGGVAYHFTEQLDLFVGARWIYFEDPDFPGVSLDDDVLIEGGLHFYF
jgi:opacity protein-like surface antigen